MIIFGAREKHKYYKVQILCSIQSHCPRSSEVWLLFPCTRFTYLLLHKMLHETYADHLMLRWKLDLSYSRHWGILREEDLYDLHFTSEIPALTNPQNQKHTKNQFLFCLNGNFKAFINIKRLGKEYFYLFGFMQKWKKYFWRGVVCKLFRQEKRNNTKALSGISCEDSRKQSHNCYKTRLRKASIVKRDFSTTSLLIE